MTSFARVKEFVKAGDITGAIKVAAKSNKLGPYRCAILDAHLALTNPGFLIQLKKDPEQLIEHGRAAVISLVGLDV